MVTDLGGSLADWKKLYKLKKRYKFQIVNDKCHSIGSRFKKKISYSTNFSEIATLSFHAVKHITTGEGGAILTNNENYIKSVNYSDHMVSREIKKNTCGSIK